jgi:hemerythrin-like metal-binding protein
MVGDIQKVAEQLKTISAATQEQAASMEANSSITESNATAAEELAASSEEMAAQSQELLKLVSRFKISEKFNKAHITSEEQKKIRDTNALENERLVISAKEAMRKGGATKEAPVKRAIVKRLKWNDVYSTSVKDIDDQHKKLFEIINNLGDEIKYGRAGGNFDTTMKSLIDYTKYHFGFEEDCMTRRACPVAAKNKEAHDKFINLIKGMEERAKTEDKELLAREIHEAANAWLVKHICGVDTRLKHTVTFNLGVSA